MSGRIRQLAPGRWLATLVEGGRRWRHRSGTPEAARAWLKQRTAEVAADVEPLPLSDLMAVREALRLLPPGVTLLDAVRAYAPALAPATVREIVSAHEADKSAANLRPRTLYQLRYCNRRLVGAFGDRPVASVTSAEIAAALVALAPGAIARNNLRRSWSSVFRWAIRAGLATGNPVEGVTRAVEDDRRPGILTPDEASALLAVVLRHARRALVPYFALGLFAGLRVAEVCRLRWSAVDLRRKLIRVDAEAAKTRRGRIVAIHPTLGAWLAGRVGQGAVVAMSASTLERELAEIRRELGRGWPRNALRHSFASYRLAVIGDAGKVATELGHGDTAMLYRHYRELVTPAAGRRYFALTPEAVLRQNPAHPSKLLRTTEQTGADGPTAAKPAPTV